MDDNQEVKFTKKQKAFMFTALFLMLVVLPLGSWVYLSRGANYYRGIMKSLGDYGQLPAFDMSSTSQSQRSDKDFEYKLSEFSFGKVDKNELATQGMKYVYDQFDDNKGVAFASINPSIQPLEKIDTTQWFFFSNEGKTLKNKLLDKDTIVSPKIGTENTLILIDTTGVIRRYYSAIDTNDLNRMITTMSLLMPRPEKASVKFQREREK